MSVTVVRCPRCHDEVGFGAPYCPHCGRDMMEHAPIERTLKTRPDNHIWSAIAGQTRQEHWGIAAWDALIIGIMAAIGFAVVDAGLFAVNWRWGLLFWTAALVILVFAISEHIVPASRDRAGPLYRGAGTLLVLRTHRLVPSSPIRALIIEFQLLLAIALVAMAEGQIPV